MPNQKDPFSGTWVMNPQASNLDPNHRPAEATVEFEPIPEGYIMRSAGVCDGKRVEEQPQRFVLDGREHAIPGAPDVVTVSERPDPNTIRVEARSGDMVVGAGSYTVSEDGSTLTATVGGIDAQQRTFQTRMVLTRQQ